MLNFCRNKLVVNFNFRKTMKIGGREQLEVGRLRQSQVLCYDFDSRTKQVAIVICQDQIEQVIVGQPGAPVPFTRQVLKNFVQETLLVFAEFVKSPQNGKDYAICVDIQCNVHVYDMVDLQRPKLDLTEAEEAQYKRDFVQPIETFSLL